MANNNDVRKSSRTTYNMMSEWINYPLHLNIFSRYKQEPVPSLLSLQNQINYNQPSHLIKSRKMKHFVGENLNSFRRYDDLDNSLSSRNGNTSTIASPHVENDKSYLKTRPTYNNLTPRNYYLGYLKRLREVDDPELVDNYKFRSGNGGSSWRHVNCYLKPDGKRYYFIDGIVSQNDQFHYN